MRIDWRYERDKRRDFAWLWAARHLPKQLAYWSYIVQGSRAMKPDDVVPDVRYCELLQRMADELQ